MLILRLFGSPRIELNQKPIHIGRRKAVALLAYLAVTERSHERTHLASLLWPEFSDSEAKAELRRALSTLNKALGSDWFDASRKAVGLADQNALQVDVVTFRQRRTTRSGRPEISDLEEAVVLASGPFMDGFALNDAPEFELWQTYEREALQRQLTGCLEQLTDLTLLAQRDRQSAIAYARQWTAIDPLNEIAHRRLMSLLAIDDQRNEALAHYQALHTLLQEELGAEPDEATQYLIEQIRRGEMLSQQPQLGASPAPYLAPSPVATEPDNHLPQETLHTDTASDANNLPTSYSSFVGREDDLALIAQRLADPACRFVTLIGPGGIGKTRLAVEAARQQFGRYADGVWLVELADTTAEADLAVVLGETLGVEFQGNRATQQQLMAHLSSRVLLFILDNVEHLIGDPLLTLLTDLLKSCAGVQFLATSRVRLGLSAEWLLDIYGLAYPSKEQSTEAAGGAINWVDFDALRLFAERAARVQARFALDEESAPQVAALCRMVEGMPLAIELTATLIRGLPLSIILQEIGQSAERLATSEFDIPQRHRSMRAVFDYSWRLLSPEEQMVFMRLAIFRGGFTQEAASDVAEANARSLMHLVDCSLLTLNGERYGFHPLLQEFALALLEANAHDFSNAQNAHTAYFIQWLQKFRGASSGGQQIESIQAARLDWDNCLSAWYRSCGQSNWDDAQSMSKGFILLIDKQSLNFAGEEITRYALEKIERDEAHHEWSTLYANLLTENASYLWLLDRPDEAEPVAQKALRLAQKTELWREVAQNLNSLGAIEELRGNYAQKIEYLKESLDVLQHLPERVRNDRAATIYCNWSVAEQSLGNFESARGYAQQAVDLYEALGDEPQLPYGLINVAKCQVRLGEFKAAEAALQPAIAIGERLADQYIQGHGLSTYADVHLSSGHYDNALSAAQQAAQHFTSVGQSVDAILEEWKAAHILVQLGRLNEAGAVFQGRYRQWVQKHQDSVRVAEALPFFAHWQHALRHWDLTITLATLALQQEHLGTETRQQMEIAIKDASKHMPAATLNSLQNEVEMDNLLMLLADVFA